MKRLFLVITIISLILVVIELGLKLSLKKIGNQNDWTASPSYKLDSDLIYSRLPNGTWTWKTDEFEEIVTSNNVGFRDKKIGAKNDNIYRIIAVGDSFTFGHGIEKNSETYPKQLESYLNKNSSFNKKIEVINAAEKGYSPDQEYRQIQKKLLQLHPDMIIWNFSIPGDLFNLIHNPGWPTPSLYDINNGNLKELNAKYNWLYISNYFRYHFPSLNDSNLFNIAVRFASNIKFFSRKPSISNTAMMNWAVHKMILEVEQTQITAKQNNFQLVITLLPYPNMFSSNYQNSLIASKINEFKQKIEADGIMTIDVKEEISSNLLAKENHTNANNVLGNQDFLVSSLFYKKDYHPNKLGAHVFALIIGNSIQNKLIH